MTLKVTPSTLIGNLRETDIFAGLSDESLFKIAELCTLDNFDTGELCAIEGEKTEKVLIVNNGKVDINMKVTTGMFTHTLTVATSKETTATLTRGKICVWAGLIPPHLLTASVKCDEATQIINLTASDLKNLFLENPKIGCAIMENLTVVMNSRLRASQKKLVRLIAELIKQSK